MKKKEFCVIEMKKGSFASLKGKKMSTKNVPLILFHPNIDGLMFFRIYVRLN